MYTKNCLDFIEQNKDLIDDRDILGVIAQLKISRLSSTEQSVLVCGLSEIFTSKVYFDSIGDPSTLTTIYTFTISFGPKLDFRLGFVKADGLEVNRLGGMTTLKTLFAEELTNRLKLPYNLSIKIATKLKGRKELC